MSDEEFNLDDLKPNALELVEEFCEADRFENAIRRIGVGNACEWFGHQYAGEFAKETVQWLKMKKSWQVDCKVNLDQLDEFSK